MIGKVRLTQLVFLALLGLACTQGFAAGCDPSNRLDLTQTTFLFNFLANSTANPRGTAQQLADFEYGVVVDGNMDSPLNNWTAPGLIKTLGCQLVGGDWKLAWGPGVYEILPLSGKADNTAYVVYSPSLDTYILAIAGTDATAILDWLVEDLEVGPNSLVNWPYPASQPPVTAPRNPGMPQISLGTAKGLYYLLNQLVQAAKTPQPGVSLGQYLRQLQSKSAQTKLIVTGHSLGGALAPTVANWARLTLARGTAWRGSIYAMPTAGPTPGNKTYAKAWDRAFPRTAVPTHPGNHVQYLNSLVYNGWDLVPHAWNRISTVLPWNPAGYYFWDWTGLDLFNPKAGSYSISSQLGQLQLPANKLSKSFLAAVSLAKLAGANAQMGASSQRIELPGTWPMSIIKNDEVCSYPGPGPVPIPSLGPFLEALGQIHIWGYGAGFGIPIETFASVKARNVVKSGNCQN